MTTNHTELCERLRNVRQDGMNDLVDAAIELIESQAARIAELEYEAGLSKPIDPADASYPNALGVAQTLRRCQQDLLTEAKFVLWQVRRIAELKLDRDALREDARQFYNLTQGDATVIIRAPSSEKRDAIIAAANRLRAALQAEKETPSDDPCPFCSPGQVCKTPKCGYSYPSARVGWRAWKAGEVSEAIRALLPKEGE